MKALATTAVFGSPSPLRRAILGRAIQPGRLIADRHGHKPLSEAEILAASGTMFHPSCTCAIGREDDRNAVVDPECRVCGVRGLRVAYASIMLTIPSANTNIPTIMIAERAANFIRGRTRQQNEFSSGSRIDA